MLKQSNLVRSILYLGIIIGLPSTAIMQKFFGLWGAFGFLLFLLTTLYIGQKLFFAWFLKNISLKTCRILTFLTFLLLLVLFTLIYPLANSGIYGGGSDSDEQLNIATQELLHGNYPYYVKTSLNNKISLLPGALVLAAPFVLLGNGVYQNFFWLLVFYLVMRSYYQNEKAVLLLCWSLFLLSPAIMHVFMTGSDYPANCMYLLIFMLWFFQSAKQRNPSRRLIPSAIFLGIGFASRLHFLFLLPLLFSSLYQTRNLTKAICQFLAFALITTGIIVPFYVFDPAAFTPLHTQNKLAQFRSILPYADYIIISLTGLVSFIFAFKKSNRELPDLFINCALVLAVPVICGVILSSIEKGHLDFTFAYFGVFFVFFGVVAYWREAQ